ncbi:ribbon-helix-helix domain-containing protein [Nitrospirillum amazonense]|nr:ribbon-helix-helix domain-containing protein [Nitrospirillum amazonense]
MFDVPYSEPAHPTMGETGGNEFRGFAEKLRETRRRAEEEAARMAQLPAEKLISMLMPVDMIERLAGIAKDAGTNRSQLIRQIVSDFLNYVWANGIRFNGSTLGFRHRPLFDERD